MCVTRVRQVRQRGTSYGGAALLLAQVGLASDREQGWLRGTFHTFIGRRTMAEATNGQRTSANTFSWSILPVAGNPLLAVATDINGKLLENVASAQKDWAEFVHRRVKEDIAASQRLMNCRSLTDMQQVYSQYLQTAFEQCREQSRMIVRRGTTISEVLPSPESGPKQNHEAGAALGE